MPSYSHPPPFQLQNVLKQNQINTQDKPQSCKKEKEQPNSRVSEAALQQLLPRTKAPPAPHTVAGSTTPWSSSVSIPTSSCTAPRSEQA